MKIHLALLLLIPSLSWGLDNDKCYEIASDAPTRTGLLLFVSVCSDEIERNTGWYNRSKDYKCAKKAFKKPTKGGVGISYRTCMGFD